LRNKRKARNSSGSNSNSTDNTNQPKVFKPRGPSEETEKCLSVSDVFGQANAVLDEDTKEDNNDSNQDCLDNSVFVPKEYSSGDLEAKMAYLKAQSMRNNLLFTGIDEDSSSGNEPPTVTERKLREHLIQKLKVARETAEAIRFERVHRTPSQPVRGKVRTIVAKFTFFKDRETVRRQWPELQGTNFSVFEQFPPEVVEKRRRLQPKLKEAKREGKRAWIAYDTLYVDGRAVT